MELIFKSKFKKNSQKLVRWNIKLKEKITFCINDFSSHVFHSKYYRKPLKNLWTNIHELQIGGDIRIIIELLIVEDKCYFLNIGTHTSLNLTWNKKVKI